MIELDGSEGEGGGQILRTALGLSALTGQGFMMRGVRANRSRPGLAAQHLAAVQCVAKICCAEIDGAHVGSQEVSFRPGPASGGTYVVHVGTAGSVMLVLQAGMLASVRADGPVTLEVHGGTDVPLAPPASYYHLVLLPLMQGLGLFVEMELVQRGFYPEGGGKVIARISPAKDIRPMDASVRGELLGVEGVAFSRNLPEHVTDRMAMECRRRMVDWRTVRMGSDRGPGPSTGAGVVLAARFSNGLVGASCLGERGLSSETVACLAVDALEREMAATVDIHAADQLLPYLALASGPSALTVSEVSPHMRTQMATVAKFLDVRFEVSGADPATVIVRPSRT